MNDRYLVAFVEDTAGNTVTGVSFGGSAMTQLGRVSRGPTNIGTYETYAYGIVAPLTGSQTFTATRTGTAGIITLLGIALSGASQVIGPDAIKVQQGPAAGTPKSDTITTIANNTAVLGLIINDNGAPTLTTQTQLSGTSPSTAGIAVRTTTFPFTPAGAVTFNWSQNSSGAWSNILLSIAPSTTIAIHSQSTWTGGGAGNTSVSFAYNAYPVVVQTGNSLAFAGGI